MNILNGKILLIMLLILISTCAGKKNKISDAAYFDYIDKLPQLKVLSKKNQ